MHVRKPCLWEFFPSKMWVHPDCPPQYREGTGLEGSCHSTWHLQEAKDGWRWKEKVGAGLAAAVVMAGVLSPPAVQSFQWPPLIGSDGVSATLEMKVTSSILQAFLHCSGPESCLFLLKTPFST